jgi:hypothetical protein
MLIASVSVADIESVLTHESRSALVRLSWLEETSSMDRLDRLDQLRARSRHEIEAHAGDFDNTDTGRYFIDEASELLAGMRMWSQSQYRTDQVVKEILEAGRCCRAQRRRAAAAGPRDIRWMGASESIALIASRPAGELMAVAGYALRAL